MAVKTGIAVIGISGYSLVLAVHILLVMFMAVDACEYLVIRWIVVAIGAQGPLTIVFAGINREILAVMVEG